MFDFANVLFGGPCNRACPFCIGQQLPNRVNHNNLEEFPPKGIEQLIEAVNRYRVKQIILTGTVTDPQLYRHEGELLSLLRERLHGGALFSLHTNGALALRKIEIFNRYDRVCLSITSFNPETYLKTMGSRKVPEVVAILKAATVPVKISCVVNEHNADEIPIFVDECWRLGVKRLVLRRLFGETRRWEAVDKLIGGLPQWGQFRNNPICNYKGMELTYWDFDESNLRSLNLFADGTLGTSYLLKRTPELVSES